MKAPSRGRSWCGIRPPQAVSTPWARCLWISYDDGENWTMLAEQGEIVGGPQMDIAFDPLESERVVLANANGLWRSEDGGLSWTSLNDRLPNFPRARFRGDGLALETALLGKIESAGAADGHGWPRRPTRRCRRKTRCAAPRRPGRS
ncbi:MAG: hypothetical protein R2724_31085 [Bryobacterales bacterium]